MDGKRLVALAREIMKGYFEGKITEPELEGNAGVFVTLKKNGELRGCIGVPIPMPLGTALKEAATGVLNDPRFPPVRKEELKDLTVEVSILTPPERVSDPLNEIEVGKHGIIIRYGPYSGLLLPQVPVEEGWGLEEFLDYGCLKAGLPPGCWKNKDVEIYRFEAKIFEEKEPNGEVFEKKISDRE